MHSLEVNNGGQMPRPSFKPLALFTGAILLCAAPVRADVLYDTSSDAVNSLAPLGTQAFEFKDTDPTHAVELTATVYLGTSPTDDPVSAELYSEDSSTGLPATDLGAVTYISAGTLGGADAVFSGIFDLDNGDDYFLATTGTDNYVQLTASTANAGTGYASGYVFTYGDGTWRNSSDDVPQVQIIAQLQLSPVPELGWGGATSPAILLLGALASLHKRPRVSLREQSR